MKKITLNEENIIKKIDEGTESYIYLYREEDGSLSALKIFKDRLIFNDDLSSNSKEIEVTEEMLKKKETKLDILSKEKCFKGEAKLLNLVYDKDGKFIGYTRKYINRLTTLDNFTFSKPAQKLEILHSLRNKIEELNKNDIYIGDFGDKIFYFDNNEVKLLDVDSFSVKGIDFGIINYIMRKYLDNNSDISNIDNFCFNFYSIAFYSKIDFGYVYNTIMYNGLPWKFRTRENKEICKTLYNPKEYKKKYVLDHMKEGLF